MGSRWWDVPLSFVGDISPHSLLNRAENTTKGYLSSPKYANEHNAVPRLPTRSRRRRHLHRRIRPHPKRPQHARQSSNQCQTKALGSTTASPKRVRSCSATSTSRGPSSSCTTTPRPQPTLCSRERGPAQLSSSRPDIKMVLRCVAHRSPVVLVRG